MKKQLIAIAIISSLSFSNVSLADDVNHFDASAYDNDNANTELVVQDEEREHTEELVGLTSGAVLGAVVGGPVGAIIGAFAGTLIGKTVGDDTEIQSQKELLAQQKLSIEMQTSELTALHEKQQSLAEVTDEYLHVQAQLSDLKAAQQQQLQELAIGLNVQFKTGSSTIEPHFEQQLDDVAYLMALSPELKLDLTGYADRRGDSKFNQALSEQRLIEVTSYLVSQGVSAERLHSQAYGASAPLHEQQSFENDFFDRRVTLKVMPVGEALAAN
ncbi:MULTISPECIES: sortase-associated OmpA-like protein PdsO [Shewanella]|uniref:OmpA/MotB domain protein n=1 Tax=Shewanella japonica TaxID=93973 RepID=A0ABM6JKF0_9GAMM|nr:MULTISPECIES: sortase-associated OmpA-like protein PdsO [Shewanella]ARD22043.1 OmpA/MotB domain protein [Shewanella japonica]KPZ70863.1 putative lipoprotein YiaD precursor [Shewanella sp. P1-14-1]